MYAISMADYTKRNLLELENMSAKYGHDKDMEARFASKALNLKESGLGYQKIHPNRSVPFKHKHEKQEEIFIVISGAGFIDLDGERVTLKAMDAVRVPAEVVRTLNAGPKGLEVLIVGAPKSKQNDTIMIKDA